MNEFLFTSLLEKRHRGTLERILFFNQGQKGAAEAISWAVDHYGQPRIEESGGHLRIGLDSDKVVQSLFVLDGNSTRQLLGTVVFTRDDDVLQVLYIAVREDYSESGTNGDKMLFFRIVDELRGIARRIKGISSVRLIGSGTKPVGIPIR